MLGANLVLVAFLGQVPELDRDRDPAVLVAQLGAARYADRQAAAEALEKIGRPALPALRSARGSRDLEIRTRAWSLAQRIEEALLTQPTRVKLEFDNALLTEVTKVLGSQSGLKVDLYPKNLPKWRFLRVTLHMAEPVDFWKAVDLLCGAAGLQYNSNMHNLATEREPTFAFMDGPFRAVSPISDHGPFRVSLLGVDYQRHVSFATSNISGRVPPPRPRPEAPPATRGESGQRPRPHPVTTVQFAAQLLVAAEPRLSLTYHNDALQLVEAIDNRGNSLVPPGKGGPYSRSAGYFGMMTGPVVNIPVQLHRPPNPGESIKKLRGNIPLSASARRPDPLIVPLANAVGKSFENPDIQLIVDEIRQLPNTRTTLVELTLRPSERDASSSQAELDGSISMFRRSYPPPLQIELTDQKGQLVPWMQSNADVANSRVTLTVSNLATELKELRYYTLTRSNVNVPFEFTDIPLP
jgi:hypothetical protein